ncbi:MAG: oligosaccharide flippase family protein [Bacteroidales bacterium]|nr:oligosaccharide flippase family protein [Bacteroidales bacterium]
MSKKFLQNLIFLILLNVIIKPVWIFAIDRNIQNIVGANEYGFYISLFNFSLIFNMLADFGLTHFNTRNISQNKQLLSKHIQHFITIKLILVLIYVIITFLFAFFANYSERQLKFLVILVLNQAILTFVLYFRSNISALQLFKTDSIISVIDKLILIIICAFLIFEYQSNYKIIWLVYAQTASYLFVLIISFTAVYKNSAIITLNLNLKFILAIIKKSSPFALLIFLMTIYTRIDSVMLERMLENGSLYSGIYAQAFRIIDAFSMFAFLFAALLLPIFSKMIKEKKDISEILKISTALMFVSLIIAIIPIILYSKQLMQLLYNEHYELSFLVLNKLLLGFFGIASIYIFGTLLTANGNLKQLNIISLTGAILNIVLNFVLIPDYKADGAAFSSMITQILMAALQIFLVIKIFRIKINYNSILKFTGFLIFIILNNILIKYLIKDIKLGFILMIISSLVIALIFRILNFKMIKDMFLLSVNK